MIIEEFLEEQHMELLDSFMDECHYKKELPHVKKPKQIDWRWDPVTTSEKFPQFSHVMLARGGKSISPFYRFFNQLLTEFLNKHQIEYKKVIRACLNLTYHNPDYDFYDPHVDYPENHYVAILYLNDAPGNTLIFDKQINFDDAKECGVILHDSIDWENNPIPVKREIKPEKYKMLLFDGRYYHALRPTTPGDLRLVCVYNVTF